MGSPGIEVIGTPGGSSGFLAAGGVLDDEECAEPVQRDRVDVKQVDGERVRRAQEVSPGWSGSSGRRILWVPRTLSRHATCTYSCMRPPSRFRRSGRMVASGSGGVAPVGGR